MSRLKLYPYIAQHSCSYYLPTSITTDTMGFLEFPTELMEQIVSYLDYNSAKNLDTVVSNDIRFWEDDPGYVNMKNVCGDRLCVYKYMENNFGNARRVFTTMSKNYVYLSGGRSLEFFVPGIITKLSDWDFYVPMNISYIGDFMDELENVGVKWMNYEEDLIWKFKHYTGPFAIEKAKFRHVIKNDDLANAIVACGLHIDANIQLDDSDFYSIIVIEGKVTIDVCDSTYMEYGDMPNIRVASGLLTRGSETMLVQLMGESRPDGCSYISSPFSYHSSCVQSFISPYVSCHLYGKTACKGIAHGWRNNIGDAPEGTIPSYDPKVPVIDTSLVPKWDKYAKRGFRYVDPELPRLDACIRRPTDEQSIWIEHDYDIGATDDIKLMYQRSYANMTWYQNPYGLHTAHPPTHFVYGYNEIETYGWITYQYCKESREKGEKYLPAGVTRLR